jgi:hypothetical protein
MPVQNVVTNSRDITIKDSSRCDMKEPQRAKKGDLRCPQVPVLKICPAREKNPDSCRECIEWVDPYSAPRRTSFHVDIGSEWGRGRGQ